MEENERLCPGAAGPGTPRRRPGVRGPSPRSINGLLEWIDTAQRVNGTWIVRFLAVEGVLLALLLLASAVGLLPR
jgi:hypothetical protein